MNILLLEDQDFVSDTEARLQGQRLQHIRDVLKIEPGQALRAGRLGGLLGEATVAEMSSDLARLQLNLHTPPPAPSAITLVCALPRPKALRRMIRSATELGVKQLHLINANRVEKSYWQSPLLQEAKLRDYCLQGLSLARDTVLPSIELHRLFKPFVEDRVPQIGHGQHKLLAHPDTGMPLNATELDSAPVVLALGPEGGFIDYEAELLQQHGFRSVSLGARILRCETALSAAVGQLNGLIDQAAAR